jgi:hypothetical protein
VRSIFASRGAHPDVWAAPRASVQTLADAASPLTAAVGWGATPGGSACRCWCTAAARSRCSRSPTTIAYDGLMVHATSASASPIREACGRDRAGQRLARRRVQFGQMEPARRPGVLDLLERLAERACAIPTSI